MNVEPYAKNRITLPVGENENDYINASPIILGTRRYIATQGPTDTTSNHFWRMIAETARREHGALGVVIVMLTQTHEAGKEKCSQYFPLSLGDSPMIIPSGPEDWADGWNCHVILRHIREVNKARSVLRAMTLVSSSSIDEPLDVGHLLFSGWPDFMLPEGEDRAALVRLIQLSNLQTIGDIRGVAESADLDVYLNNLPIDIEPHSTRVIHCSAGVGRTGTFIALDYLLSQLYDGEFDDIAPDSDPVVETVDLLRQQRMMMVQGESQFGFIYEVLREEWVRRGIARYDDIMEKADAGFAG